MLDLRRLRLLRELQRARHDRRGRRRAAVHAVGGLAAARGARARGRRRAARARRPRRAPDRRGARAGRARRGAARARRASPRPTSPRRPARVAGRARVAAFQSVILHLAIPAMRSLARARRGLRCELVESEPEQALPALALGDVDLVLGRRVAAPAARGSRRASCATTCSAIRCGSCCRRHIRLRAATPRGPARRARGRGLGDGPRRRWAGTR